MNMPERLKDLRSKHNLTQKELAAEIGVALSVIGDIESGRRPPSKKTALKLSRYFQTPIEIWLNESETKEYLFKREKFAMLDKVITRLMENGLIINGEPTDEAWKVIKEGLLLDLKFLTIEKK